MEKYIKKCPNCRTEFHPRKRLCGVCGAELVKYMDINDKYKTKEIVIKVMRRDDNTIVIYFPRAAPTTVRKNEAYKRGHPVLFERLLEELK
jgi:hypothetical protein